MINRLIPKAYREQYRHKRNLDEKTLRLTIKLIASLALVFIVSVGIDVYHFFH